MATFKVKDPDPGPVEPAQEFVPYVVPTMTSVREEPVHPVWSVSLPEVDEINEWLPERLKDRWPRMNDWAIKQWLIQAMGDRATLLIRTPSTIGLFFADKNILEPMPRVREVFVRGKEGKRVKLEQAVLDAVPEYIALYRRAMEWAKSIKAVDFTFGLDSDAAMARVSSELSTIDVPTRKVTIFTAAF